MLDRDESALHAVELSIYGSALLESPEVVLCDIRDRSELERVFLEHQPQVVFHAAALKHLTLLERYPHEALQEQRLRHAERARRRRPPRRQALRQHLDRQGGQPHQRARPLQAARRAADGLVRGARRRRQVPLRPLRQRPGLPRLGAARLRRADRARRPGHGHRPGGHPLLHDHPRGLPARHPGRRHRPWRRGAGARHGRAGEDRRRRLADDRDVGQGRRRDRVHRPARRREDARGAARLAASSATARSTR